MKLLLASNSPRRAELLSQINMNYECISVDVDEVKNNSESSEAYVQRLALDKAKAGWEKSNQNELVLGADTIVVCDSIVMEKPRHKEHAREMMQLLSGNTHTVLTAIAIVAKAQHLVKLVKTNVTFKVLSDKDIADYWETGEPQDKAGGYGIQGIAGQFVTQISGSYSAVVGLPLYETVELIKECKGVSNVC